MRSVVTVLFVIVAGMYGRAWYESSRWLAVGVGNRNSGAFEESVDAFRRSVSWVAPGLPYSERAYEALWAMAHDTSLTEAQRATALAAAKRGLRSSRGILDKNLGRLNKAEIVDAEILAQVSEDRRKNAIKETHPPHLNYLFQFLALICFVGWISSVLVGIWHGFDAKAIPHKKRILVAVCTWAIFFGLWLVALRLA